MFGIGVFGILGILIAAIIVIGIVIVLSGKK